MRIFDAGNGFVGFGSSYIPKGNISINVDGLFLNGFRVTFFNPSAPLSYGTFLVTEIQKANNSFCTDLNDLLAYVLPIFQVSSGGGGSQNLQSVLDNGNTAINQLISLDGDGGFSTFYRPSSITVASDPGNIFKIRTGNGFAFEDFTYGTTISVGPTSQSFIDYVSGLPSLTIDNAAATTTFFNQSGNETFRMDRVNQEIQFTNTVLFDISSNIFSISSQFFSGMLIVDGIDNITSFNTESFSVSAPVFPNIFGINGLSNTVSFDTSTFDVESDIFRVGSAASPEIMVIDGTSNIVSFNTGFGPGGMTFTTDSINFSTLTGVSGGGDLFFYTTGGVAFEMNTTGSFFQLLGISKHSIRGGSPPQDLFTVETSNITFGTKATFLDSTATTELFQINTANNRLQAFAPIIATDSIGDYIKCETPSGPRAIRLDNII